MAYRKRVPSVEIAFFRDLTKAFDIEFVRRLAHSPLDSLL